MQGRYGMDQLGRFLLFAALALIILSFFFGGMILDTIAWRCWCGDTYGCFPEIIQSAGRKMKSFCP